MAGNTALEAKKEDESVIEEMESRSDVRPNDLLATGILFLSLGAIMISSWLYQRKFGLKSTMQNNRNLEKFDEENRDVVDEASWESFPASDSPAW